MLKRTPGNPESRHPGARRRRGRKSSAPAPERSTDRQARAPSARCSSVATWPARLARRCCWQRCRGSKAGARAAGRRAARARLGIAVRRKLVSSVAGALKGLNGADAVLAPRRSSR
ncbi:hypothetical protein ACPA9J_13565 [Pseudomonas aeruginosa]